MVNIIKEVDEEMIANGVESAVNKLEELVGLPMPKGTCICRVEDGHVTFIGDTAKDKDELAKFVDRWDDLSEEDGFYGMSFQEAKDTCSGDFIRKE